MRALILVDIQNDFTPAAAEKPNGALAVTAGNEVIGVANRLMPQYELVVATQDWHPSDHRSFASQHAGHKVGDVIRLAGLDQVLWPDHCVQNTFGAALCRDLDIAGINAVVPKGTDRMIDSYSGFFDNGPLAHRKATGLANLLHDRGVRAVDVVGLATDYCVKATAIDAAELGFVTRVLLEGCRGVELRSGDCAHAIDTMRDAGVQIARNSPELMTGKA